MNNKNTEEFRRTQRDNNIIHSVQLLVSTIQHMNAHQIQDIDNSAFFLTIPINHFTDLTKIEKVIYNRIRKAFYYLDQQSQIGLILCGDVNGTRSNLVDQLGYQNPHFHALLLLPEFLTPKTQLRESIVIRRLRFILGTLIELPSIVESKKKIYIRRLYTDKKSIFDTISYITKSDTNFFTNHAENFKYTPAPELT